MCKFAHAAGYLQNEVAVFSVEISVTDSSTREYRAGLAVALPFHGGVLFDLLWGVNLALLRIGCQTFPGINGGRLSHAVGDRGMHGMVFTCQDMLLGRLD